MISGGITSRLLVFCFPVEDITDADGTEIWPGSHVDARVSDFVLTMTNFVFKMVYFAFKMMNFGRSLGRLHAPGRRKVRSVIDQIWLKLTDLAAMFYAISTKFDGFCLKADDF